MISKPMLASKLEDLSSIRFPVLATPKLDGIRCLIKDGEPMSRSLKPIPNKFVSALMKGLPDNLDGELMLVVQSDFNTIQSQIMSEDGKPDFKYYVFDYVKEPFAPYNKRMYALSNLELPDYCTRVYPTKINNMQELLDYETVTVGLGFEGVMIRQPDSPYKFGRSTPKEQYLIKIKRFEDSEAEIIGFEELMHNDNTAEEDKLGHTKRSSKKEGLVPAGTLGMLKVKDIHNNIEFGLGTGFTAELRKTIWDEQHKYKGLIVKYKYQGIVEKPRFPSFVGFRSVEDL